VSDVDDYLAGRLPPIDVCELCGKPEGDKHWSRACGDCVCNICGEIYFDHPPDKVHVGYDGHTVFRKLCNGDLVKL